MEINRDNFTKATIEMLAKRVGYVCSNPNCLKPTIGANEIGGKATSIGIAAHITAAASGGPRYDESLIPEQRRHIDNGIWLCSNCATLIDKDENKYTIEVLRKWKNDAEEVSRKKLKGEITHAPLGSPYLEVDLIWTSGGRSNRGYSHKNPIEMHEGRPCIMINSNPIIYWTLYWSWNFVIYNNSNYAAFNIKIESIGSEHFSHLDKLPRINNLPPLQNFDLQARFEDYVESDHTVADKIIKSRIPEKFKDLTLKLTYQDEARYIHTNYIEFSKEEIINRKA